MIDTKKETVAPQRILIAGLIGLLATAAWADTRPLGQVLSENMDVDGLSAPPGTTLLADSMVRTHQNPGLVHLRDGRVIWLDHHTSASFESTPAGETRLEVHLGRLTLRGPERLVNMVERESLVLASLAATQVAGEGADSVRSGAEVGAPAIEDAETPCLPGVAYPTLSARISPAAAVDRATVYFRAGQFSDFYTVEMRPDGERFEAVLPQPHPDTAEVVYYVEAVGLSSDTARTPEYVAAVGTLHECAQQGAGGRYAGTSPPGRFVSTVTGASRVPPGFIADDDPPPAVAARGGWFGGLSTGAKVGIAAGGAVAVGFLISELDDSDEAPASPVTP